MQTLKEVFSSPCVSMNQLIFLRVKSHEPKEYIGASILGLVILHRLQSWRFLHMWNYDSTVTNYNVENVFSEFQ